MSVNEITGDRLVSAVPTDKYREGYEAIFGKPKQPPLYESEYLARSRAVIRDYWECPEEMWERLDLLESEYKGS